MKTISKKKNILAAPEIVRILPDLKGEAPHPTDQNAVDLLRAGSLFEIPVRSPYMIGPQFRHVPQRIRRWIRALYGLIVLLHEKFDANRKTAYFLLLEQIWKERMRAGKSGAKTAQ